MSALRSGGEFINQELTTLAEYLDVRQTSTAANSPNQNGCNERKHAVVDRIIEKMLFADPTIPPEIALCWALNAKNTLENNQGFSPAQLVFGENPSLPSVYAAGPPGWEEVEMSKSLSQHIQALHLAREAFMQVENDKALKTILKKRVYSNTIELNPGDWIYYKNDRKWEGPIKITTKDGKLLYAVRAGKLVTINADHAKLVKTKNVMLTGSKNVSQRIHQLGNDPQDNTNTESVMEGLGGLYQGLRTNDDVPLHGSRPTDQVQDIQTPQNPENPLTPDRQEEQNLQGEAQGIDQSLQDEDNIFCALEP